MINWCPSRDGVLGWALAIVTGSTFAIGGTFAIRGIVRAQDELIPVLLAGTCDDVPMRGFNLGAVTDAFAFTGGIGLWGGAMMPSLACLRQGLTPN
jgi:hypothetical protein